MEELAILVDVPKEYDVGSYHNSVSEVTEEFVGEMLDRAFEDTRSKNALYLDDWDVQVVDRDEDEVQEICSGNAVVWVAESDNGGEVIRQYDVEYEIWCGKSSNGFVYDTVEVIVSPK